MSFSVVVNMRIHIIFLGTNPALSCYLVRISFNALNVLHN